MATILYLVVLMLLLAMLTLMYRADERERRYQRRTRQYRAPRIHTSELAGGVRVRQASNSRPWR